ncbi:extracellular solute-binding protein [Paenibacillus sp. S-38]|uniref:extracellular solute-binding protein n=1 Tax=Paenibacillus sp. S-38 TaxID=3416710 RepID=UPI003CF28A86
MKVNINARLLAAGMLGTSLILSACSGEGEQAQKPQETAPAQTTAPAEGGSIQSRVKPAEFSLYVNYDWYTAPAWAERPHGKWITENLKVSLKPIQSNGAAAQKLNAMIVSGDLPDVVVLDRGKDVERLQKAGKLVALDPYLAKYPEFVKNVGEKNLNMLRSADGKLYQIPNWYINGGKGNGNAAYLVERKIHKALGSPKLETWDDVEAYLKLVKEKYPDVIPLDFGEIRDGADVQMLGMLYSGAADDRTPAFQSPGSGQVFGVPKDGRLTSIYQDEAFREAALVSSRWFRQGLTSQDLFTQTRDQILEKLKTGKIAVFGAYDAVVEGIGREANNLLKAKDPQDGYDVIWPIHKAGVSKDKVFPSGYNTLGWNVNVITTKAKDPEAIFSYMNWATSPEGQQILFYGPPGLFYDKVDGGVPIPNEAYIKRDPKKYDELKIGEFNWNGNTAYVDSTKGQREKLLPEAAQDWTTQSQANVSFKTSKDMTEFSNLDPVPNSEEGIILQRLKDHYKQTVPKIFFAKSDEEVKALIAEADQEAAKLGYEKLLQWKTGQWQANLKKLQGQAGK